MKITHTEVTEMASEVGDMVTEVSRALDTHSLEALCRVWRQSRSDHLPHICNSLQNIVIHLNGECQMMVPWALSLIVKSRPLQSPDIRLNRLSLFNSFHSYNLSH